METENYCVAGRLRMLARVVTMRYNDAFAGEGVTMAQAALLMRIFAQPGIRQVTLSKALLIEKSAMSRDIQLLQRHGWLDANVRAGLHLTESGTITAKRCHKIWKQLNASLREDLGPEAIDGLSVLSARLQPPARPEP
ncbi:MarR family winged helix-turn-helix transcriptional regulator [Rudanella paleaurantiibacter]|nr:MarR family winged helix-turn-helix transcriptional regulator [Rudanella paleaurantiibacter]